MTHKVHPKIFRAREMKDWDSRGFYGKKFPLFIKEDQEIRKFLEKKIGKFAVGKIEIERFPGKMRIIISTARPGLIIGRGGEGVTKLRKEIGEKILKKKEGLDIEIREIRNPWSSAPLVAQWMASQIERRVPYRRVLKQALAKIMSRKEIKGARVEVKGRLNGIINARKEWLKAGRLPRQTLRADIDYAQAKAYCTYGVVGVKVWIYKGEII